MDAGAIIALVLGIVSLVVGIGGSILYWVIQGVKTGGRIETKLALVTRDQHETSRKIDSWRKNTTAHQKDAEAHFMACDTGRALADQRLDQLEDRIGQLE